MAAVFAGIMRFQRYDEIVTEHSTPTSTPDVTPPDGSLRIVSFARRAFRIAAIAMAAVFVLLVVSFLGFRFLLLPNLDRARPYFEEMLSGASGMAIKVGRIDGEWQWWAPLFTLSDVRLQPVAGASEIRLSSVALAPAWKSWLHLEPRLSRLSLQDLELSLVRNKQGQLFLNGIDLSQGRGDNQALDWLLRQDHIELSLRQLRWHDQLLALPPLAMNSLKLDLSSGWRGHRLQLQGRADSPVLPGLALDASWTGEDVSGWRQWQGKLTLSAGSGELSLLKKYWPEAPFSGAGRASSQLAAEFEAGRIASLQGRWQVEGVTLAVQRQDLPLPKLAGELDYRSTEDGSHTLAARHLTLAGEAGPMLRDASLDARWHDTRGGRLDVSGLSLAGLWPLLQQRVPALVNLPVTAVQGELGKTSWQWKGSWRTPQDYRLSTRFQGVRPELTTQPLLSGGLSGELELSRNHGRVSLNAQDLTVQWPEQFVRPLSLQQLAANIDWQQDSDGWQLQLPSLRLRTPDFSAELDGHWQLPAQGATQGELHIRAPKVAIARVSDYLPQVIGGDTVKWLHAALTGGEARNVRSHLRGDFSRFPFAGGQGGSFTVDADIARGSLRFDPEWPQIIDIDGRFAMRNDLIQVDAASAQTAGVALAGVKVRLPDLMTKPARLLIDGQANGALPGMLAYTRSSPVDSWLGGFLSGIDASGAAGLKLGLDIPLETPQASKVSGDVQLLDNRVHFRELPLPVIEGAAGVLHFNEHGVSSPGIRFAAFGGQGKLQAVLRKDNTMAFTVLGEANVTPVLQEYVPFLSPLITGTTPYRADFTVKDNLEALQLGLSLKDSVIHAPAPFAKASGEAWPLQLSVVPAAQGWSVSWQQAERAQGTVALDEHGQLRHTAIGFGTQPPESHDNIAIAIRQPEADLLPWLGAVHRLLKTLPTSTGPGMPLQLSLQVPHLSLADYRLQNVDSRLDWAGGEAPLLVHWQSDEVAGEASYDMRGAGVVKARLARLSLPLPEIERPSGGDGLDTGIAGLLDNRVDAANVPALDLAASRVFWGRQELGQLSLKATAQGSQWQLEQLALDMAEGRLLINGVVPREKSGALQTAVDASIDVKDAGGVLTRFGMPDAMQGGRGKLAAHLVWNGRLRDFDLAQLGGELDVDVRNGRFSQVNPGAARLLGVLSLQSLSRRLRLDFTDVFSSGFAFDALTGHANVKKGVFGTSDLQMTGPGARVNLSGEADLARNQQNIRARVTPNLSEGVSLLAGATLVNPALGAVTLLTQKILQDPINKVFSFDYQISGSLTDPQVSKVGESVAPKLPNKAP